MKRNREYTIPFQVVTVLWGDKYPPHIVNYMAGKAFEFSPSLESFYCITTLGSQEFTQNVQWVAMPQELQSACNATTSHDCKQKLSVFKPGLIPESKPTLLLDLDCLIKGNLSKLAQQVKPKEIIAMKNHLVPTWRIERLWPAISRWQHYFGNSSLVGFIPKDWHWIYAKFQELQAHEASQGKITSKYFAADDRFLSWCARGKLRCWDNSDALRFQREYSFPLIHGGSDLANALPWKRRARSRAAVISFDGPAVKPETLATLKPGDRLQMKWRRYIWRNPEFSRYWQEALQIH